MFEPIAEPNGPKTSSDSEPGEGVRAADPVPEIEFENLDFQAFEVEGEPTNTMPGREPDGINDGWPGAVLTKDQFFEAFRGCFNIGHQFTGLESLAVPSNDNAARAACDAVYDIAYEVEYLRFLISPGNVWIQRTIAIGAFAVPKWMAIKAEIMARQKQVEAAEADAANDNQEMQFATDG